MDSKNINHLQLLYKHSTIMVLCFIFFLFKKYRGVYMIYWLIIIIILWIVSSYLYHTSTFEPPEESDKEFFTRHFKEYIAKQTPKVNKPISSKHKDSTAELWDLQPIKSTMFISAEVKQTYLNSSEWWKLRDKRMILAQYKCECCGSTWMLSCHHVTYIRLTREELNDVVILCGGSDGCHQKIHDILGYDRATEYPISTIKK